MQKICCDAGSSDGLAPSSIAESEQAQSEQWGGEGGAISTSLGVILVESGAEEVPAAKEWQVVFAGRSEHGLGLLHASRHDVGHADGSCVA